MNTPHDTATARPRRRFWVGVPIAIVLAGLCYGHTAVFRFVADDAHYVVKNPYLRDVANWGLFFASDYWESLTPMQSTAHRPLLALSLSVDGTLFGQWPGGYHLTNAMLHGLVALLAGWVVAAVTGRRAAGVWAAILFAVSPAHVEAVAWVKNRGDLLAAGLALAAVGLAVPRRGRRTRVRGAAALAAYLATLMTKLTAATLPLLLAPYERIARPRRSMARAAAWVLIALGLGIVVVMTLGSRGPLAGRVSKGEFERPSPIEHGLLVARTALAYVRLAAYGDTPGLYPHSSPPRALVRVFLLALAGALAWAAAAQGKSGRAGLWVWFFVILLVPVSNLRPLPTRPIALQRVYLPSVAAAALLSLCMGTRSRRVLGLAMVAACASLAVSRSFAYSDNARLYDATIAQAHEYYYPRLLRATEHLRSQQPAKALRDLDKARARAPFSKWTEYSVGSAQLQLGRADEALVAACRAAAMHVGTQAYLLQGHCLERVGQIALAEKCYREAAREKLTAPMALNNLGNIYLRRGQRDQAIEAYRAAVRGNAAFVQPRVSLGAALIMGGDYREAAKVLREAARLATDQPPAVRAKTYFNLSIALEGLGDRAASREWRYRAEQLSPGLFGHRSRRSAVPGR